MFDTALDLSGWLLSWLDADWRAVLAVPLMIVLLLVALSVIVRLLPAVDRVLGPLGAGLAMLLGMLLLLPEYLCTVALRRQHLAPPGFFHTYGDGVAGIVQFGTRVSRAGLAGFTREARVRRSLIVVVLAVIVVVGNANSCPTGSAACSPTLATWWTQTKTVVGDAILTDEQLTDRPTP